MSYQLIVDRCIETGSTHLLCEDYGLSGVVDREDYKVVYGCVSDGCSTAPNSDLGARFLCHSFASFVKAQLRVPEDAKHFWPLIPHLILRDHASYATMLGVHPACMHATFWGMVFFVPKDETRGFIPFYMCGYGDGGCIETSDAGDCTVRLVRYASGAPYYPIYHVVKEYDALYRSKFPNSVEEIELSLDPETGKLETVYQRDADVATPFLWEGGVWTEPPFQCQPAFSSMALFSDGMLSFQGKEIAGCSEADKLLWFFKNYMTFPVQTSNFLTRNFRFMASESRRTKTVHTDDLGGAAFMLKYTGEKQDG